MFHTYSESRKKTAPQSMETPPSTPVASRRRNVHAIADALRGIPWALTGSMAMKMHALHQGRNNYREPRNTNILVNPEKALDAMRALQGLGFTTSSVGVKPRRIHMEPNLNILTTGAFGKMNARDINGLPLQSLNLLIERQENLVKNGKSSNNLDYLRTLAGKRRKL